MEKNVFCLKCNTIIRPHELQSDGDELLCVCPTCGSTMVVDDGLVEVKVEDNE